VGLSSVRGRKFTLSLKVMGRTLGIYVLYNTFVIVYRLLPHAMFLVKPIFFRYFRKFLMTSPFAEMSKGYIDVLLSLEIFLFSRAKFS